MVFYDYDLKFVELADPEWDNYEDEYVISIVCDEIFCEKPKLDGRYCMLSPKFVFFDENANSKCVKYFESDMKYEFEITEEESGDDSDHMIDHHDCDDYDCDSRSKDNSMNVDFSDDGQDLHVASMIRMDIVLFHIGHLNRLIKFVYLRF